MRDEASFHLAANIRTLRETRGLTQQQMAKLTGVPRATLANLESGGSNPTLSVLVRVAAALQIRIEELIGPPKAAARFYRAADLPVRTRGNVTVRKLLPDALAGFEIERMEFPVGSTLVGVPHTPGTREYLTCEVGQVQLTAAGESWRLEAGELVVFRGDQRHSYKNLGGRIAIAYSVVAFAPM
ncbi:MAG TPA: XRE family transcriptional regulator [Polyangiales bacterium]|jgi:transcriptional regulator with XRE-family HTH domain|nr:XRE family transcriptional regulator [Polyangiales bacterium]